MTDQDNNKIDTAVALEYNGQQAPKITAKGEHELAEEIVRIAEEYGIPLYHDASLARSLAQFDLGTEIPESLYRTIAEIIAFAYKLQNKVPEGFNPPS